ncbi:MAG TPA: peptidoglycan editing factor PgeF [Polyangiales bacterium]
MMVLRARNLSKQGFSHGFSTRLDGVSAGPFASLNLGNAGLDAAENIAENQRRFAREVGYAPESLFTSSQVHGRTVRRVRANEAPESLRREEADALLAERAASVGVRTADCVPLLLADPSSRAVVAVHAGWRGAAAGIACAAVETLAQSGVDPSQLMAAVFPHIRACCFEVGAEVVDALAAAAPAVEVAQQRPGSKPHAILIAVIRSQLMAAGMRAEAIEDVPGCTCCEPERFFSFRRDGAASGRHLAAIVAG